MGTERAVTQYFVRHYPCQGEPDNHLCATNVQHAHCVCGLAMAADATFCELCTMEGLVPGPEPNGAEWDGKTYPSFRQNRLASPSMDGYIVLFEAVRGDRRTFMMGAQPRS